MNIGTGNKYQKETIKLGLVQGGLDFTWYYNSLPGQYTLDAPSPHWQHSYDRWLASAGPSMIFLHRQDGKVLQYVHNGTIWVADADVHGILEEVAEDGVQTGWTYRGEDNSVETYSLDGRLLSVMPLGAPGQTLSYDMNDRLERVDFESGQSITFSYDSLESPSSMVDSAGRYWGFRYDGHRNLEFIDYPDGSSRQYHYNEPVYTSGTDLPHALTGISDERGVRYATFEYQADGRAMASYHAGNAGRVDISYDDINGTRTVTNSLGQSTTYKTRVQLGASLVAEVGGPGCSSCGAGDIIYNYDPANNLVSQTENSVTTRFGGYDHRGQAGCKTVGVSAADSTDTSIDGCSYDPVASPDAHRADYTYDSRFFNRITRITEPSVNPAGNKVTVYAYDEQGNRTSETVNGYEPDGQGGYYAISRTTARKYEGPLNQLSFQDGPRTDVNDHIHYRYYPNDASAGHNRARLREVEDAHGVLLRSNIQYTATGKVQSEQRPNGLSLTYTYHAGNDRLQRLTEVDASTGKRRITHWRYVETGEVKKITTAYGSADATKLRFTYDDARRLKRISDGLGNYIKYTVDSEGNRTSEKVFDAGGTLRRQLTRTFDIYNRLDTTAQANEATDYDHAPDGTLDGLTDGKGAVTDYTYDALKRLTQTTQDLGGSDPDTADTTTQYAYDVHGQLTRVIDPNNGTTVYVYDDLGNRLSQSSPDTGTSTYTYDSAGNLKSRTDARGQLISYSYDALNRLSFLDAAGDEDDIAYTYDSCTGGIGRLCSVTRGPATADPLSIDYSYTAFGDVLSRQGAHYTHDAAGRLKTLTYPSGALVSYAYDVAGQVSQVDFTLNGQTRALSSNHQYQPFGGLTAADYGNGLTLTQSYDLANRLETITWSGVYDRYYAYTVMGHPWVLIDNLDNTNYQIFDYDALDRIRYQNRAPAVGNFTYGYDRNGNRIVFTDSAGQSNLTYESNSNRLAGIDGEAVTVDATGNITAIGNRSFVYNVQNRLIEVLEDGVSAATYRYNGLGQRVVKQLPAPQMPMHFVYGLDGQLLGEYQGDGTAIREYVYLNGRPIVQINGEGQTATLVYLHADHLGTPRVATDETGTVVWSWDSEAYGTTTPDEDVDADGTSVTVPLRFPGQYYDRETGLHYNYFRYYDPTTGRYMTSDPIGLDGGINTYIYALSNPANNMDAFGLAVGAALACEAINGAMTVSSLYNTLRKLQESTDLIRDQLNRVNNEIDECPSSDTQRLHELNKIRNDLVEALAEALGQNTPMSMGDVGPGIVGAGLCGLLLALPPL